MEEDGRDTSSASSAPTIIRPTDEAAAKQRAKKGRRPLLEWWLATICSNAWEAVLLLVTYVAIRWFPRLKDIAVTLLATALAVIMKEILLLYGYLLFRFRTWTTLTRNLYVKISAAQFGSALPQRAGYTVLSQLPGIPVYVIGLPVYILFAMCLGRPYEGARFAFWQRMGTFTDDVFAAMRFFGDPEDEAAEISTGMSDEKLPTLGRRSIRQQFKTYMVAAQARKTEEQRHRRAVQDHKLRKQVQTEQDVELGSATAEVLAREGEPDNAEDIQDRVQPQARMTSNASLPVRVNDTLKRANLGGLVFSVVVMLCAATIGIAVCAPLFVMCVALAVVWIAVYFALLLSMIVYIPVIITVFLVSGSHLGIFIFVGIQIVTSLLGINLGTGRYEWILGACFFVPLYMWVCYAFAEKLVCETLSAMKHRLGDEHKLSKLSDLYPAIPIDGSQSAIKTSDCATGKDGQRANRTPAFFVMSVHDGDLNHFLCRFVEKDHEHFYLDGMLTKRKNETDLTGIAWKGLENNARPSGSLV